MKDILFKNAVFHTMKEEEKETPPLFMTVRNGMITGTYTSRPQGRFSEEIDLKGQHVYPCLIDGHTHMLYTIVTMAMGLDACTITPEGIKPDTLPGVGKRLEEYCKAIGKNDFVVANGFVSAAVEEGRLPSREELDLWCQGRPAVVYNIDGHSCALSSAMMRKLSMDPEGHSGLFTGEDNDRLQGRLTDIIADKVNLRLLARGIAQLHNQCAENGICMLGALEGNGDSPKDSTTKLIFKLARRFDLETRFYLQYMDLERVRPFAKHMKHKRLGGCGDFEMDGAVGSHSAAFSVPYKDTGKISPTYYEKVFVQQKIKAANEQGYQVASHAIGDSAIELLLDAMNGNTGSIRNRIEHIEFINNAQMSRLNGEKYSVFMQPGYAWIDKRYLHSYSSYLNQDIIDNLKLRSIAEHGVPVCLSSDSPVQSLNPYLQMLGMCDFYNAEQSMTTYEAMKAYTINPAVAMGEDDLYGTLEEGKIASFFTSDENFFSLSPSEISSFKPNKTYYKAKLYKEKKGTVLEFLLMLFKKPKKV